MSAYLRNNIWQISSPDPITGKPIRISTGMKNEEAWDEQEKRFITKAEVKKKAEAMAAKKLVDIAEGRNLDKKVEISIKLKDFIEPFINGHSKSNQNRGWKSEEQLLTHLLHTGYRDGNGRFITIFYAEMLLSNITADHFYKYQDLRRNPHVQYDPEFERYIECDKVTNSTINRSLAALRKLLNYAFENKLLANKFYYKALPDNPARQRTLTKHELEWIHANADGDIWDLAISYQYIGFRKKEVQRLEWTVIDCDRDTILLTPTNNKSKKPRYQPMHPAVKEMLLRRRLSRDPLCRWVFPSPKDKSRYYDFTKPWKKMVEKAREAGIPHFTIHDFRRTFASDLLNNHNENLETVQDLLGHADPKTTRKYIIVAPRNLKRAVNNFQSPLDTKMTHRKIDNENEEFNKVVNSIDSDSYQT